MTKVMSEDAFLSDRSIQEMVEKGQIRTSVACEIEPASLDVRTIGRQSLVPVSFLPSEREPIEETIARLSIASVPGNTRIMPGAACVTLVRLDLELDLPPDVKAVFSPKSSIGRIDLNVRVMPDGYGRFDETSYGFKGRVYAELRSSSFPVQISQSEEGIGAPLTQVRFVRAADTSRAETLIRTQVLTIAVGDDPGWMSDLRDPTDCIQVGVSRNLPVDGFWRKIPSRNGIMILKRGAFYIARSREHLAVAADECSVLRQIEPSLSMVSCHYAGFADPGFGMTSGSPSSLVFEIRNPENDLLVRDGQPIGVLETHRLDRRPTRLYGEGRESYQGQSVRLARCFADPEG